MRFRNGFNLLSGVRLFCTKPTSNGEIRASITNRNPRNLERLRLARKPRGYIFEDRLVEFWHKLTFSRSNRGISASLVHNSEHVVVTASTQEWCIRKFIHNPTDVQSHIILAKIFAQRCFESGINYCESDVVYEPGTKTELFLKTLMREGFELREPDEFNVHNKFYRARERKPWTVLEPQK